MSEKSELISKLKSNKTTRQAYLRAKLNIIIPSQIRALRLRREMTQEDLASEAEMLQPRISAMERPGSTKFSLETLIRIAAAFKIGLIVKFAPFSEMLKWENEFGQDTFDVTKIDDDFDFQRERLETPSMHTFPPSVLQPEMPKNTSMEEVGLRLNIGQRQDYLKNAPHNYQQNQRMPNAPGEPASWTPSQLH